VYLQKLLRRHSRRADRKLQKSIELRRREKPEEGAGSNLSNPTCCLRQALPDLAWFMRWGRKICYKEKMLG